MAVVWDAALPQVPMRPGFTVTRGLNAELFEPDSGKIRARRKAETQSKKRKVTFQMNLTQYAAWEDFWTDDLKGGALACTMPDPINGGTIDVMFVADPVEEKIAPTWWAVTLTLLEM